MIQVNRIYLIFNRLVTKKFLVDTSEVFYQKIKEFLANTLVFFLNSKAFWEGRYSAEKRT